MDPAHPLHATANSIFYDHPRAPSATVRFDVPRSRDWASWAGVNQQPWRYCGKPEAGLPEQGWKVHVSATHESAEDVLTIVAEHCYDQGLAFKFLSNGGHLEAALAKDADRAQAGKFITVYPATTDELYRCLRELESKLAGSPGPYILSDLRWNDGPLYVRYGAFRLAHVWHEGREVPAIRNLQTGMLVPDIRGVAFAVPQWVTVPEFIADQMHRLDDAPPDGFPQLSSSLHHSNAGGVYAGTAADSRPVVVKEARPHTGRTPDGRDAVERLRGEARVLRALATDVAAPTVIDELEVHGHRFLVMERVEGRSLSSRVATHNPLGSPDATEADLHAYGAWAQQIGHQLRKLLNRVHQAGHTHGDLHPGNVLIDDADNLTLIDFEMSVSTDADEATAFGVPGFVSTATANPVSRDEWAAACIELHLLLPLTPLLHLDPAKADELLRAAAETFGLDAEWVHNMAARLQAGLAAQADDPTRPAAPLPVNPGSIRFTLERDATPDRTDRLWPGDPRQFQEDPLSLAHGALGVAWALARVEQPSSPTIRRWVGREVHVGARRRFGLMDGVAGAAWACRELGWDDLADDLFGQLLAATLHGAPSDLYSGLPGIALALLRDAGREPRGEQKALEILERLDRRWRTSTAPRTVSARSGGLFGGASGTALLALALYARTGDEAHIRSARRALEHDLHSLTTVSDGSVHVNEGWRTLPYLGWGSAGIGVMLACYLSVDEHRDFDRALDGIICAATAPFTAQVGLLQGRAGLMTFLAEIQHLGRGDERTDVALERHRDALMLHALRQGDAVRFAGDGLLRASCDLATGSAGVLLALHELTATRSVLWPRLNDVQNGPPSNNREGGETDGVSPFPPDARAH